LPTPGLNIAFTHTGLAMLGAAVESAEFVAGMAASRATLADPGPEDWEILGPKQPPVHGVFLVTGATEAEVDHTIALRLAPFGGNGWTHKFTEVGTVRPGPFRGHEHFGYADGLSQPAVRGRIAPDRPLNPTTGSNPSQAEPGRDLLWPGEFVFGYPGQHPKAKDMADKGPCPEPISDFTKNGAFLVFRRLRQYVPEFDLAVKAAALSIDPTGKALSADLLGAQLVGRWKSGAPLIRAPHADDPAVAAGTRGSLDFEFGGDRYGLLCPWAAHIRKVYSRDDVPGKIGPTHEEVEAAEAETQRHRMIRRGITYGPELRADEASSGKTAEERGLLFVCYITNIAEQFEDVQKDRVNNPDFVQDGAGVDAIIGQSDTAGALPFTAATPFVDGEKPKFDFKRFVHMEGGEYFFAPSLPAICTLAKEK
jgi:Dyp-type peroxidase family